jgi:AcrR family transcriptional regulator
MNKSSHRQPSPQAEPRRQPAGERGQRRRDLILDTAAALLAELGPEAINTNALAERAQISVGSVYQYFSNKEMILTALGERYLQQLSQNTVSALQQDVVGLDFVTMVNRIVEPMIAFERRYPAFRHLNAGQEGAGVLAEAGKRVEQEVLATIFDLLRRIAPELETAKGWQVARVTKALYKGISYLIQQEKDITSSGGDVDKLLEDMKRVMADYLASQLLQERFKSKVPT